MNNQIDKLMVKAGAYFGGEGVDYSNFDPKKFAELIVRECVDVISKEVSMKYKDGSGETEEFMAGHYGGSLLARVVIAQHFGVEK